MKIIKRNNGNNIKVYATTLEDAAFEQIKKLGEFEPYQNSKIRIMPDVHAGKGCTIGTTMTIFDKITPNLVGVDGSCGMLTVKLKETDIDLRKLDKTINEKIPHGFNIHSKSIKKIDLRKLKCLKHVDVIRASKSVGSLGSGNHFIELAKGLDDSLYLVIHTGSRNLGVQVCKYYQNLACKEMEGLKNIKKDLIAKLKVEGKEKDINKELSKIKKPKVDKNLAFLEGEGLKDYLHDMKIVQKYAVDNRAAIAEIILNTLNLHEEERFETIHNYIDFNRMILRKGAVSAEKGEKLLIPINMRDGSIIALGKGNPDWNYSAPHGAGRLMSRGEAHKKLNLNEFKEQMKDIYSTSVLTETLDEAPNAYKPIDEILNSIKETVEVIEVIKPIYNFKSH